MPTRAGSTQDPDVEALPLAVVVVLLLVLLLLEVLEVELVLELRVAVWHISSEPSCFCVIAQKPTLAARSQRSEASRRARVASARSCTMR
jgi:hypothetical protein